MSAQASAWHPGSSGSADFSNIRTLASLRPAMSDGQPELGRRDFLRGCIFAAASAAVPVRLAAQSPPAVHLAAAPASANLVMEHGFDTSVWAYNNQIPGPLLRYRQGDTLNVTLENQLSEPTTVHWHGLRVPVAMDGVPHISQKPIAPGASHSYSFALEDAGTFWYHPHMNSSRQVGKGLHGVLIVDEAQPPDVDRDVLWVLDDWRLTNTAELADFSPNLHDASHNGRLGNVVTVNGTVNEQFFVRSGERLRLRLANVANARTFALNFEGLSPWVIALDGHPVEPHRPENGSVVLGAGQRTDLIIDVLGDPGSESMVLDDAYGQRHAFRLMRLIRRDDEPLALRAEGPPPALAPNPVSEPVLDGAIRHRIVFEGGAMGGLDGAELNGEFKTLAELAQLGKLWATNGQVPDDVHFDKPLLSLDLGKTYILELSNRTSFEHPVHLHGHAFRVIAQNEVPIPRPVLRDTVLIKPGDMQEIAFVADNPGKWMLHCHILEHQEFGMASVIAVA